MDTTLLHLEALPPQTTRGTIVRLLEQVGELPAQQIGAIEVRGKLATAEVPTTAVTRLVKALDGVNLGNHFLRVWAERGAAGERGPNSAATRPAMGRDHFEELARLLELESAAEAQEALQRAKRFTGSAAERTGNTLVGLAVRDETVGLGGRVVVTFGKRDTNQNLPWTRLGVGSPVLVSEENVREPAGWRGVVCGRDERSIEVAFDFSPEPEADRPTFRVDLSSDEIGRQRQRQALERARTASGDRLAKLRDVLIGEREPEWQPKLPEVDFQSASLNESQRAAIRFALAAHDVAIIHGPPGTGKTTTLVELIRHAVARGDKVLACAPSNLAVDNLLERLIAMGLRAVRLGHPARVLPELREHTLDVLVDRHHDVGLARKLVRDAQSLKDKAGKWSRAKPDPGMRRRLRDEARQLLADARRLETQVVHYLLDSADVLCVTLTALDSEMIGQREFDLAVIDEACQTTEPACWLPILRSQRVVLAGDHCQLPPTVVSPEAARAGFNVSLLERLMTERGASLARRLETQYRMHEVIMGFSSHEFYDGALIAADEVREHLASELPDVTADDFTARPVHFFDTAGASYDEEIEPDGESRRNPGEADVVERIVRQLLDTGIAAESIGIITPYSAQVRLLRERLAEHLPALEVDSVDGFQGREKEVIVVSLVRSNSRGEIGFLADVRRINVALTRARRLLIVVGDSATIGGHPFYERLINYWQSHGAHRSVWEMT